MAVGGGVCVGVFVGVLLGVTVGVELGVFVGVIVGVRLGVAVGAVTITVPLWGSVVSTECPPKVTSLWRGGVRLKARVVPAVVVVGLKVTTARVKVPLGKLEKVPAAKSSVPSVLLNWL